MSSFEINNFKIKNKQWYSDKIVLCVNRFYYCREIDHKGFFEKSGNHSRYETFCVCKHAQKQNFFIKIINIVILVKVLGVLYLDLTYTISGNTNMVPQNYPVEQIVQLCLLDKELPHFVAQIETILKQYQKPQDEK